MDPSALRPRSCKFAWSPPLNPPAHEEYQSLVEALETEDGTGYTKGVAVTGQPGIGSYKCWFWSQALLIFIPYSGKTTFLIYLLLHRLKLKLPTAVQLNDLYYSILDEQGATVYPIQAETSRLRHCWVLTDSNVFVVQPCLAFMHNAKFIVQTTSPKPERWRGWVKQYGSTWVIMDLPSVSEIAAIL